jgi:hypothetical protein
MARKKVSENVVAAQAAVDAQIEVLEPKHEGKRAARNAKRRRQKSLRDKIQGAIEREAKAQEAAHHPRPRELYIKKGNVLCYPFPWQAMSPQPWRDGYTRVLIPLKDATRKGSRCLVQIVRNDNLAHGRAS